MHLVADVNLMLSKHMMFMCLIYLVDELREVLSDNSEGSATHSKVIVLFLLRKLLIVHSVLQVYLHSLKERG